MFKATLTAFSLLFLSTAAGCAIHTQAPVKEVAYDFSDHDFYDRAYAPSPDYAGAVASASGEDGADASDAKAKGASKDAASADEGSVIVIVGKGKVTVESGGTTTHIDQGAGAADADAP